MREMADRAVDALAQATQALARADLAAAERALELAASTVPMLDRVMREVAQSPGERQMRTWSAAAVLVARHLERIANNAAEIASRVQFLVTGRESAPEPEPAPEPE
jgi:phosphate uptake regulator